MRLQLTRRTELSLRALHHLAHVGRSKSAAIAEAVGSSPGFVTQVLHPLVREGWLRSDPGPAGGYELATDLSAISLLALIEVCEGPTDNGRCVLADRRCPAIEPCALHEPWLAARASLTTELERTRLDSIPMQGAATPCDV